MKLHELQTLSGITPGPTVDPNESMGSNISWTATQKHQIERERGIEPGTPEWFRLWFSLPYLTGERPI